MNANKFILLLIITLFSSKSYGFAIQNKIPLMFIEILQGKRDVSLVNFIFVVIILFLVVFLFVKISDIISKKNKSK